ncbi:MAG: hypothetical protein V3V01_13665 [Acidimicrobiales bacterium]
MARQDLQWLIWTGFGLFFLAGCSEENAGPPTSAPTAAIDSTTAAPQITPATVAESAVPSSTAEAPPEADSPEGHSISYVGVIVDQTDLSSVGIGGAGYWFPQFDVSNTVEGRPTDEAAIEALPDWAGPLNHFSILGSGDGCSDDDLSQGCRPGFAFRTFSQDGPATSSGGQPDWASLTLPSGQSGLSGAIIDPHTDNNSNNTVNRIQLGVGVPSTFYFHIVTDNTAGTHNPTGALRARGNIGLLDLDDQVEADETLEPCDLLFNGVPDIYTFKFSGFAPDDYIKLRLSGFAGDGGASFGGLLFDELFELPEPNTNSGQVGSNPSC